MLPDCQSGSRPEPLAIVAVPTRAAAGHVPAFASLSPHGGTPATSPSSPGGRVMSRRPRPCSRSCLETVSVNGVAASAWGSTVPALNDGENPPSQPAIANDGSNVASGVPCASPGAGWCDHGSSSLVAVTVPQLCGLASSALGPPWNASFNSLSGCWGRSAKLTL